MAFINTPIMTCDELVAHTTKVVGASADPTTDAIEAALQQTFLGFGNELTSKFFIEFVIQTPQVQPFGSYPYQCQWKQGICEINLAAYGIDKVELVEISCGDGCWKPSKWWRTQDNRIIVDGRTWVGNIRITYNEAPALILGELQIDEHTVGDASMTVMRTGISPVFNIPTSGYVLINDGDSAQWFEYRGIHVGQQTVGSGTFELLGVQTPAFVAQMDDPMILVGGSLIKWGVPVPSTGQLDSIVKQAAAYYWASRTNSCNSDEERDTAMQLMNFWSGEAEKAWERVQTTQSQVTVIRKRQIGDRLPWLYQ